MIKGILFDLDGTIVDSEDSRLESSNQVLKELNLKITQKEWNQKYKRMNSIPIFEDIIKKNKTKNIQNKTSINTTPQELYQKAHKIRAQIIEEKGVKIIKGFEEFYKQIKQQNLKMIICSGGKKEHVNNLLKKIKLDDIQALGREDYKEVKPSPDCYLKGLEILNLNPNEVIAFDDSYNGIKAAKNAKIKTIIAINSELEKGIKELNPTLTIKDWTELNIKESLGL